MPLTFANEADYDRISLYDELVLPDVRCRVQNGEALVLENKTTGETYALNAGFSERQIAVLLAGGLLDYTRENG